MNVNEKGVTLGRCLGAEGMEKDPALPQDFFVMETLGGLEGGASVSEMKGGKSRRTFLGVEEPYEQRLLESVLILMRQDSWHLGSNGIQHLIRNFCTCKWQQASYSLIQKF